MASVKTAAITVQNSKLKSSVGDSMTTESIAPFRSNDTSVPEPARLDDLVVGAPFSNVAEHKLQLSLDELINQETQQKQQPKENQPKRIHKLKKRIQPYTAQPAYHVYSNGFSPHTVSPFNVEDLALTEVEILYPPADETDALIIRYKGTDVLKVRKTRGDLVLNSKGWRTMSTRLILNCALKPIGLKIIVNEEVKRRKANQSDNSGPNKLHTEWIVTDGFAYLAAFQDDMVIGQVGGRSHLQLLARASVIAQHMKQVKSSALSRRQMTRRYVKPQNMSKEQRSLE